MNTRSGSDAASITTASGINATTAASTRQIQRRRSSSKFRRLSFRSKKARQAMVDRNCKDLAIEGERLCKEGLWEEGIQRLEAAIKMGTTDLKTVSALYSQLGNAYFYLENYSKSLEYHKQDLTCARSMGDKLGEAKASGNIGGALKAMGQFDESIACCRMQLDLTREIADKAFVSLCAQLSKKRRLPSLVLESRALYNLGNVYHARGKHAASSGQPSNHDKASLEDYVRTSLEQATRHYELNLKLVRELGDSQAQGRTVGNLGNTHYLLGNYKKAIKYHAERLSIAEHLGDKVATRRAYSNLGNAQVFLGKYSPATQYYLSALEVASTMGDLAYEAQACYSLGNTYTLMKDFPKAIDFHSRHLRYAIQLQDRVGEARAYWSLGNSYTSLGDYRQARHFSGQHLQLAAEIGDTEGVDAARKNLTDLDNMLQLQDKYECPSPQLSTSISHTSGSFSWASVPLGLKKKMSSKKSSGSLRSTSSSTSSLKAPSPRDSRAGSTSPSLSQEDAPLISTRKPHTVSKVEEGAVDDTFLDLISKCQSHRLEDQRSDFPSPMASTDRSSQASSEEEDLFETLWRLQGSRIDEQRCHMPPMIKVAAAPSSRHRFQEGAEGEALSTDELFELIFTSQSSRINDQRSPDPKSIVAQKSSTVPSEDFFNLIQHLQSTRIEDQRSPLPVLAN